MKTRGKENKGQVLKTETWEKRKERGWGYKMRIRNGDEEVMKGDES